MLLYDLDKYKNRAIDILNFAINHNKKYQTKLLWTIIIFVTSSEELKDLKMKTIMRLEFLLMWIQTTVRLKL